MILHRPRSSAACRLLFAALATLSIWGGGPARAAGILFLERCPSGCVYRAGFESSINNTSSIITGTRSISAFVHGDAAWAEHLACVQASFAPYDITVTDVDPGSVAHWEVPVAGSPMDLGFPIGTGGVAPFTCTVIHNGVAFSFANVYDNMKELCWTTAQEAAHLFGLDHEAVAGDPMTYILGCLEKRFRPEDAPCGELSPRTCACGGTTQNSDAMIANVVGRAPAGAPLLLNDLSVSQDGFDEIGSTCQWTAVSGEESVESPESGPPTGRELSCGTEAKLLELSRAQDARSGSRGD